MNSSFVCYHGLNPLNIILLNHFDEEMKCDCSYLN